MSSTPIVRTSLYINGIAPIMARSQRCSSALFPGFVPIVSLVCRYRENFLAAQVTDFLWAAFSASDCVSDLVNAPDLQTSVPQLLDDPAPVTSAGTGRRIQII